MKLTDAQIVEKLKTEHNWCYILSKRCNHSDLCYKYKDVQDCSGRQYDIEKDQEEI